MIKKWFDTNQLERALAEFVVDLADSYNSERKPLVVIPSQRMRCWILDQCKELKNLSIEFYLPDQILAFLRKKVAGQQDLLHPLSNESLMLVISEAFDRALAGEQGQLIRRELSPLFQSKRGHDRLLKRLAKLFQEYGEQGRELIEQWHSSQEVNWQAAVWKEVEKLTEGQWGTTIRELELLQGLHLPDSLPTLFLFCLPALTKGKQELFDWWSDQTEIYSYHLSPSCDFWLDFLDDQQLVHWHLHSQKQGVAEEQLDAITATLFERNQLLAKLGRVKQAQISWALDREQLRESDYRVSESAFQDMDLVDTLSVDPRIGSDDNLHRLQASLLFFHNDDRERSAINWDGSLDLVAAESASSALSLLIDYLKQHQLADVDIYLNGGERFLPFISALMEEAYLPYRIEGCGVESASEAVESLWSLILFGQSRWESLAFLELLARPAIMRMLGWGGEQLSVVRSWMREQGVRWGRDQIHRQSFLHETIPGEEGTWKLFWERMQQMLAKRSAESDLFKDFFNFYSLLAEKLHPLECNDVRRGKEWAEYFRDLALSCLDMGQEQEEEIEAWIKALLHPLIADLPLTAEIVAAQLKERMHDAFHGEHQFHGIRFLELQEGAIVPADHIVVLGLDEQTFPWTAFRDPWNQLPRGGISRCDRARDTFLDILLAARKTLLLGYHQTGGGESAPSSVLHAVVHSLDQAWELEGESAKERLLRLQQPLQKNSSYRKEQTAPALHKSRRKAVAFSDLISAARHPIRYHSRKGAGVIFTQPADLLPRQNDPLLLSALEQYRLLEEGERCDQIDFERVEQKPSGAFQEAAKRRIEGELQKRQEALRFFALNKNEQFTLCCIEGIIESEKRAAGWFLPELNLNGGTTTLSGELTSCYLKGIVVEHSSSADILWRQWPRILLIHAIEQEHHLGLSCDLLSLKELKMHAVFPSLEQLSSWLEFLHYLEHDFIPFHPSWVESIWRGDPERLHKQIDLALQPSSTGWEDPYLQQYMGKQRFCTAAIIERWQPLVRTLINFEEV